MSVNVSEKGNIDFTKGSIIRNLILIPFYLVMVVLRQLFLAIVMRRPRIEYIYAAFPLGWGLTAFMLMIYYFLIRGQIQKKMAAAETE